MLKSILMSSSLCSVQSGPGGEHQGESKQSLQQQYGGQRSSHSITVCTEPQTPHRFLLLLVLKHKIKSRLNSNSGPILLINQNT